MPEVLDTFIEVISSDNNSEVKEQAISSLNKAGFPKKLFHLSTKVSGRQEAIKNLTDLLYHKNSKVRKEARKAFKAMMNLDGKKEDKSTNLKALKEYYKIQSLKAEELKRRIKEYEETGIQLTYDNYNSRNTVPPPFESWFEVEVFLKIHEKGYVILPQPVYSPSEEGSEYRIDMLVVSSDKKYRLAVECDGPLHDETKRQENDKNRARELEENSWTVWRISHSKEKTPSLPAPYFYSYYPTKNDYPNKKWKDREINEESLNKLWEKLDTMKIKPINTN